MATPAAHTGCANPSISDAASVIDDSTGRFYPAPRLVRHRSAAAPFYPASAGAASVARHVEVEQRRVLLRAEDIGIPRTAARPQSIESEFDGAGGIELDEVRDPLGSDAVEASHRFPGEHARLLHALVGRLPGEDHVERDEIDARVLAAYGLGELRELPRFHHDPAKVTCVGNSSSGCSQRSV